MKHYRGSNRPSRLAHRRRRSNHESRTNRDTHLWRKARTIKRIDKEEEEE